MLGTFGRGFYVLDDYTPLRTIKKEELEKVALLFPIKDAWMFVESVPLGVRGKGFQGESFYTASNPKPAAVFTYYLKEDIKTIKEKRRETEKEKTKNKVMFYYPSKDSIRLEDAQPAPHLLFVITDENGNEVRRLKAAAKKGLNRISWDFRYASFAPVDLGSFDESFVFNSQETGYTALPGNYKVSLSKFEDGNYTELVAPQNFKVKALNASSLPAEDKKALDAFGKKIAELRRVSTATDAYRSEMIEKIKYIKQAILVNPKLSLSISESIHELEKRLNQVNIKLNGDASIARREFETLPSVNGRIGNIVGGLWSTTSAPTQTYINSYEIAKKQFSQVYQEIKSISIELQKLEQTLEMQQTQFTPGRLPIWKMD